MDDSLLYACGGPRSEGRRKREEENEGGRGQEGERKEQGKREEEEDRGGRGEEDGTRPRSKESRAR